MRIIRIIRRSVSAARAGVAVPPAVILAATVLAAAVLAAVLAGCRSGDQAVARVDLPVIRRAPHFSFTSADGRTITDRDLAGRFYIASFFFTSCGGPCPVMNSTANALQAEFSDVPDFRILSFTVDPVTDTPERLTRYAERYGAKRDRWYFLRSAVDTVAALSSKGFLMGDPDNPMLHSTRFVLVDRAGNIRGYFDALDRSRVDALRAAIRLLAGEKRT